jgi:hypothetical protein
MRNSIDVAEQEYENYGTRRIHCRTCTFKAGIPRWRDWSNKYKQTNNYSQNYQQKKILKCFFTVKTINKHSTYSYISVHTFTHTYYMHHMSPTFHNVVESVIASFSTLFALYCLSQLMFPAETNIYKQRWRYNANKIYFDDVCVTVTSVQIYTLVPCEIQGSCGSEYQDYVTSSADPTDNRQRWNRVFPSSKSWKEALLLHNVQQSSILFQRTRFHGRIRVWRECKKTGNLTNL